MHNIHENIDHDSNVIASDYHLDAGRTSNVAHTEIYIDSLNIYTFVPILIKVPGAYVFNFSAKYFCNLVKSSFC